MEKMISVIIPVYNTEKYLGSCLDSVLNSVYKDFEIILINDGSEDRSLQICREYCRRYQCIKLINQNHQGVSTARNNGLRESSGKWVVFVDSDDIISTGFLGIIGQSEYQDQDLLLFDYDKLSVKCRMKRKMFSVSSSLVSYSLGKEDRLFLVSKLLCADQIVEGGNISLLSTCAKAYRRANIEKHSIRFHEDIAIGEDRLFNIEYLQYMESCLYILKEVYFIRVRNDSTMRGFNPAYLQNDILYQEKLDNILKRKEINSKLEKAYYNSVLCNMADVLIRGVFNPYSSMNHYEKCRMCRKMHNYIIYERALEYNKEMGIFPRRILLSLFQRKWYGFVNLQCRLSYFILKKLNRL